MRFFLFRGIISKKFCRGEREGRWEAVADLGEGSGGPAAPLIFRPNTDAPAAIIGYHMTVTEKGGGVSEVGKNEQTTE